MNRITRLLAIVLVLLLIVVAWIWWSQPVRVDMAGYVPADSLLYVESNSLAEIAGSLSDTDAWRTLGQHIGARSNGRWDRWLTSFARVTGIGPARSVIASRAQVAFVLLDLHSTSSDSTLEFKTLAAIVVETHTSTTRIKPAIEGLVGDFAQRAYGQTSIERVIRDQMEFVRWSSPDGKRQIVASIDGSVAIVGNDERAVAACLAARRGQRPSLAHQTDLEEMRGRVQATSALAFGFVSAGNAARLLSEMAPALIGKLAEEKQFQNLLAISAAKVLGNIGWSARPFAGGIEDYYFMSVKPVLITRLRLGLKSMAQPKHEAWALLPGDTYSVTNYYCTDPAAAWRELNGSVSSQLDTLAAVFFTSLSKASLGPYGIDEPEAFLQAIKPEVLTAKLDATAERSVVIAGIRDEAALRQFVGRQFGPKRHNEQVASSELIISPDERSAASFVAGYFILGAPEDLRRCLSSRAGQTEPGFSAHATVPTYYTEVQDSANSVTYTQDSERVRGLLATLARVRGSNPSVGSAVEVERAVKQLPYAVTETKLQDYGLERRTRSPFGQFSSFVSLLSPDPKR